MYALLSSYQSFSPRNNRNKEKQRTEKERKEKENYSENVKKTISYSEFISQPSRFETPILFRIGPYSLSEMPERLQQVLENGESYHPHMQQVYLNDTTDCESFLKDYDPSLLDAYHTLIPGAYKTDLVRLCLLEKYGGAYADMSMTFLQSLSFLHSHESKDLVLVNDINFRHDQKGVGITNGFMMTRAHHPVLTAMIRHIHSNLANRYYGESSLDVTGPNAIRKVWEAFFGQSIVDKGTQGPMVIQKDGVDYNMFWMDFRLISPYNMIEYQGKNMIQVKFDGYQDLMYGTRSQNYWKLWDERRIYAF
jgi:mannosyltransferase OCH1-like enzyme